MSPRSAVYSSCEQMHNANVCSTRACSYQNIMETKPVRLTCTVGVNFPPQANLISGACLFILQHIVRYPSIPFVHH